MLRKELRLLTVDQYYLRGNSPWPLRSPRKQGDESNGSVEVLHQFQNYGGDDLRYSVDASIERDLSTSTDANSTIASADASVKLNPDDFGAEKAR